MVLTEAIGKVVLAAFAGDITTMGDSLRIARVSDGEVPFGNAVVLDTGKYRVVEAADAETAIVGFAVRTVKQATNFADQNVLAYPDGDDMDALVRGWISVNVVSGSPAVDGAISIITVPGTTGFAIGDVVSGTPGDSTTITLATAFATFASVKDTIRGTAIVAVKLRRI